MKQQQKPATSFEQIDAVVEKVRKAQAIFATFDQEQVDAVFKAAAAAATSHRIDLAKLAIEETGMGVMEDKVIKNHFSSEYIYNEYRDTKTCGLIEDDRSFGYRSVAAPIGIVAGVIPTTNPTSTAIFKALLCLKTRNGIIFSPHPRAKECTSLAAKIVHDAAVSAGAPEGIIAVIDEPSVEDSKYLMGHKHIALILATGGPGMVKAAYSSGNPAIGVGAGNTPVLIDKTANIKMAVSSIIMSKTFDNGTICASEQSVLVGATVYDEVKKMFEEKSCYFVKGKEKEKLAKTIIIDGHLNSKIAGQSAFKIAELAGIKVPTDTKILIAEVEKVGEDEPFSYEKLSPILAMYKYDRFAKGLEKAKELVAFGGAGHTSVLYTDETNQDHIMQFQAAMRTARVLVNMPSSQGAIGDVYNFKLPPSLTLGCGSWGGNSISENIGVKHLLNHKSVAERKENMLWFKVPPKIYFKPGAINLALQELKGKKRALIVTDAAMVTLGYVEKVTKILEEVGISFRTFSEVEPDPSLSNVEQGMGMMRSFEPDVIIALGGGSPMDAAKIMWLFYENPDIKFADIAIRFMDIRKKIYNFPEMGKKAVMVAIPTTSGTGSEVTPFTVITDDKTGMKYPIADYELMPDMAIVDTDFVRELPKSLVAYSGLDAMTHAIEAYTSVFANNFSDGQALESLRLIFKYLRDSYNKGKEAPQAQEKMHYAATLAGMAFANGFLGISHSLAHKLGAHFHIPHGLANALVLPYVIAFNATDNPTKQGLLPQYKYPFIRGRYAKIADFLRIADKVKEDDKDGKTFKLIEAIQKMKKDLNVPMSIKDAGVSEEKFMAVLEEMSLEAFDDQCTGDNARYPLVTELKQIYLDAFHGTPIKKLG